LSCRCLIRFLSSAVLGTGLRGSGGVARCQFRSAVRGRSDFSGTGLVTGYMVRRQLTKFLTTFAVALATGTAAFAQAADPPETDTATPPAAAAGAPQSTRHHALSLVDKPKFGADFKHFDWVNPDAP